MKKIIVLLSLFILVTGCGNRVLTDAYKKMEVGQDKISGYTLDVRIYGTNHGEDINEIFIVQNFNNEDYMVKKVVGNEEIVSYIINNTNYILNDENKYEQTTLKIEGSDPSIYLEGLKNIKINKIANPEMIGDKTYKVYNVTYDNKIVSNILDETILNNLGVTGKITGQVYLDDAGYVSQMIYKLGTITINANYFNVNNMRNIELPE